MAACEEMGRRGFLLGGAGSDAEDTESSSGEDIDSDKLRENENGVGEAKHDAPETAERADHETDAPRQQSDEEEADSVSEVAPSEPSHWKCWQCKFLNENSVDFCVMCNTDKPPSDHEMRRVRKILRSRRRAEKRLQSAVLKVKVVRGDDLLEDGEMGVVYCVVHLSSQKGVKQVTALSRVQGNLGAVEWNAVLDPLVLLQGDDLKGQRLLIDVYERNIQAKESHILGFGDIKLEHPVLSLRDGLLKRISIPLKHKVDADVRPLRRGVASGKPRQATVTVILAYCLKRKRPTEKDAMDLLATLSPRGQMNHVIKVDASAPGLSEPPSAGGSGFDFMSRFSALQRITAEMDQASEQGSNAGDDDDDGAGTKRKNQRPQVAQERQMREVVKLRVKLMRARNLINLFNGDLFSVSSPYVVCSLREYEKGKRRFKPIVEDMEAGGVSAGDVVERCLDPDWNQELQPFLVTDFPTEMLVIEVRDKNCKSGGMQSVMGYAEIRLANKRLQLDEGFPKTVTVTLRNGGGTLSLVLQLYVDEIYE